MLDRAYVGGSLAAVALATAAYSAGRLIAAALRGRRIAHAVDDVTQVVMGVGMAGMLIPRLSFLSATVWRAAFTAIAIWYATRVIVSSLRRHSRSREVWHYAGHLLSTGSMLYAYVAPTAARDGMNMTMSGALAQGHPVTLVPVFGVVLFSYAILLSGQIAPTSAPAAHGSWSRGKRWHFCAGGASKHMLPASRAVLACDVAMNLATGIALIAAL